MKKLIKKLIRVAFGVAPGPTGAGWRVICRVLFRQEIREYNGRVASTASSEVPPSVVFFTHNRCASMMLNRRILEVLQKSALRRIDYQGLVHPWEEERREAFRWDRAGHASKGRFKKKGYYYGPFRYYVDIPALQKFSTILVLRDPRDVITSRYYSEAFAHVALDRRFHEHTVRVRKMDVDAFVREFAPDVDRHYRDFMEHHENLSHGIVWTYEEVVADFEGFLLAVNEKLSAGLTAVEVSDIAGKESFEVGKEDAFAHKRSVKPGSYLRKLNPETIEFINDTFEEVLQFYGWE